MIVKKQFSLIVFMILVGIFSALQDVVFAVKDLKILSHSSFVDFLGMFNIVGEIQNNSSQVVEFAQVHATLYNSNGTVVGIGIGFATSESMEPGEKSPFSIVISDAAIPMEQITNYSLGVSQ